MFSCQFKMQSMNHLSPRDIIHVIGTPIIQTRKMGPLRWISLGVPNRTPFCQSAQGFLCCLHTKDKVVHGISSQNISKYSSIPTHMFAFLLDSYFDGGGLKHVLVCVSVVFLVHKNSTRTSDVVDQRCHFKKVALQTWHCYCLACIIRNL